MLRRMQALGVALLLGAAGAGRGGCASGCCAVRRRRGLRCCMLRWVQAEEAALLHAALGRSEGGCAAACCNGCRRSRWSGLHAAVGASEGGCASACCGGCRRSRLRCCGCRRRKLRCVMCYAVGADDGACAAECYSCTLRWVRAEEAALLHAGVNASKCVSGGCRRRRLWWVQPTLLGTLVVLVLLLVTLFATLYAAGGAASGYLPWRHTSSRHCSVKQLRLEAIRLV